MKFLSPYNLRLSGCFFLILLAQILNAQDRNAQNRNAQDSNPNDMVFTAQSPVHLQLENTWFMAGDTANYVLQTASAANDWYRIDLIKEADSGEVAVIYGLIALGESAGSVPLPDHLPEGVYWLRAQVEGLSVASFSPVYVFGKPEEIEPEAQPPFQLQVKTDQPHLFAGATNQLKYELWPRPVKTARGRLIVRNSQGTILTDTLPDQSAKGVVEVLPEVNDRLQMEFWLNEKLVARSSLPEVLPVAFKWQLTEQALALQAHAYDSMQGLSFLVQGPEGFQRQGSFDADELLSLPYASWPSGHYTLMFSGDEWQEPLLEEHFSLRTNEPCLQINQPEIQASHQVLVQAKVAGFNNTPDRDGPLRVYSAAQQTQIFSLQKQRQEQKQEQIQVGKRQSGLQQFSGDSFREIVRPFSILMPSNASDLNPTRLRGIVRDQEDNPASKAVVTLSGAGMDRLLYTLSDEKGRFVFDRLPITSEKRYLAAFDQKSPTLLSAELDLPDIPAAYPGYELDSTQLLRAKFYAHQHFLLQLLRHQPEAKNESSSGTATPDMEGGKALELMVPQDWVSTFNMRSYIEFPSLAEFVQEVIPGLRVRYRDGKSYMQVLNITNSRKKIYYKGEPLYLLNGYPVSNVDSLLSLDIEKIEKVQLVRNNAARYYGRLAQFGIVAIYTKEKETHLYFPQEGNWLPAIQLKQEPADFSASHLKAEDSLPDIRKVIYWSGVSKLQGDGSFSFLLNTSDEAGEFIVELTFYDENDRLTIVSQPLQVVKSVSP